MHTASIHPLGGDHPTDPEHTPPRKRFRSGQEIYDSAPDHVPWCWDGYMAYGTVTLFAGRHKGGKSTLLFGLIGAMCDGRGQFLDHEIDAGPVVLLTEEGGETLRPKLEPITHDGRERIRVLSRADVTPRGDYDWVRAVREAGMEALEWGSRVVIVDTFAFWAQIRDENDNSLMQEVVSVLSELTTQGLAVVIVHHHRKGGGEDGDAIRGGTALQGAVDIIVEMIRPPDAQEDDEVSTERELRSIGRFPGIPEAMRIKLIDGRYQVLGEGSRGAMKALSAEGKLLRYLEEQYPDTPTTDECVAGTAVPKTTALRYLNGLERRGLAESFAEGGRGLKRWRWEPDPYPLGPKNGG